MNIFQIGEVPVHFHDHPEDDYSVSSRGRYTEYMYSQETRWSNSQWVSDVGQMTKRGTLIAECGFSLEDTIASLQRICGHPLPIIGYFDPRCRDGVSECACEADQGQLIWMESFGVLETVKKIYRKGQGQVADVELVIQFRQNWELLNRLVWEWSPRPQSPPFVDFGFVPEEILPLLHPYPDVNAVYTCGKAHCFQWLRRRWVTTKPYARIINSPDWWSYEAEDNLNVLYADPRFTTGWEATPYSGSPAFHPFLYSYPHKPVYIFRNLPTAGDIVIQIQRDNAPYDYINTTSTISLSDLNADLLAASLSALDSGTDWLVLGDVYKKPGYLIRNVGSTYDVLNAPRPEGVLEGAWAGFMATGSNLVTITAPSGVEVALQVTPRKL